MPRTTFKAPESSYDLLPTGTYDCVITAFDDDVSKSKQKPNFKLTGEVIGGQADGRHLMIWYDRGPKSLWKVRNLVDASGIDVEVDDTDEKDEKGKPIKSYSFDTGDLVGRYVRVDCEEHMYDEKMRNSFVNERMVPKAVLDALKAAVESDSDSETESNDDSGSDAKSEEKAESDEKSADDDATAGRRRRRSA